MKFTRDDAEGLYRMLRALCLIRPGHTLHVGGHSVKLLPARAPSVRRASVESRVAPSGGDSEQ